MNNIDELVNRFQIELDKCVDCKTIKISRKDLQLLLNELYWFQSLREPGVEYFRVEF